MKEATMSTRKILVWDAPTRLVHWLMVVSFAGAFLTAESERQRGLHLLFGVTLVALIAFRAVWAVIGTRYARFSSFAYGPRAVLRYLGSVVTLRPERHVGHPPAAAWVMALMLGLGLLVGVSGYAAYNDGPEWLEDAHEALAWTMLAAVGVHVAGVMTSSLVHRENLVGAMVTGRKRGTPDEAIRRSRWLAGAAVVALVAALWLDVVSIPGLDVRVSERAAAHHDEGD
jgi:cytochrome b